MKKIISTAFIGAIGGAFALIANYYFLPQPTSNQISYNPYSTPTQLASYNSLPNSNGADFVLAAEKSINSVVNEYLVFSGAEILAVIE